MEGHPLSIGHHIVEYALIAFFVVGALTTIGQIGKERKVIDPPMAVACVIAYGLVIWAIIYLAR